MENSKKGYWFSVTLPVLLVLLACLQTSQSESDCHDTGCKGCGTDTVDCDFAGLTSFPQLPLSTQKNVEYLTVRNNKLTVLEPTALENYTSLNHLNLKHNNLQELPKSLFHGTSNLESLVLSSNQLTELPKGLFHHATELKRLTLKNNQLTRLPKDLFNAVTALDYLDISDNQLTELPEGFLHAVTNITTLALNDNHLTELPEGFLSAATQLTALTLHNNQLRALPDGFFRATTKLSQLGLSNNQLTELPEDLSTNPISLIILQDNPLKCDCHLSWLPEFLRGVEELQGPATCATPANLRGTEIVSLTEDQLVCEPGCILECVHGTCNMSLSVCECSDGYTGVDCSSCSGTVIRGPPSVCIAATSYPVRTIAQTSPTGQCPPKHKQKEVMESIRDDIHTMIGEVVLP